MRHSLSSGVLNLETVFAKEERELLVSRRRRGGFNADYMDPDNSEKDQSKSSEESEDKEKTVETF